MARIQEDHKVTLDTGQISSAGQSTNFWGIRCQEDLSAGAAALLEPSPFMPNESDPAGRSRQLDFELRLAVLISAGNALGQALALPGPTERHGLENGDIVLLRGGASVKRPPASASTDARPGRSPCRRRHLGAAQFGLIRNFSPVARWA